MIVDVSVIGRSSQCKTNFLRAASIPERRTSGDSSSLTVPTWWTTRLSPREGDIDQVPRDSFCSSGYRLLPARLKNHTAADVIGEKDEVKPSSVLLVISCDLVFYCGKPRSTGDAANSVKTVVTRLKDRLGGEIPFVVAVSIDVEYTSLETSKAKDLLSCVSSELAGLGVRMITVSPRTELWLRDQQNEGGRISYRLGASTFRVGLVVPAIIPNAPEKAREATTRYRLQVLLQRETAYERLLQRDYTWNEARHHLAYGREFQAYNKLQWLGKDDTSVKSR